MLLHSSGAEQQIVDDFLCRNKEITPSSNVLVQASGKLVLIDKLLPKLRANGHKVHNIICVSVYYVLCMYTLLLMTSYAII